MSQHEPAKGTQMKSAKPTQFEMYAFLEAPSFKEGFYRKKIGLGSL
jgi:hypothetical protein